MTEAAMNMHVQILCTYVSFFWDKCPGVLLLDYMVPAPVVLEKLPAVPNVSESSHVPSSSARHK
jgi:hypothetical protein